MKSKNTKQRKLVKKPIFSLLNSLTGIENPGFHITRWYYTKKYNDFNKCEDVKMFWLPITRLYTYYKL